jgi:multiple sugar transport system substrate-binding protein
VRFSVSKASIAALVAAGLSALALSACGGGDDNSSGTAQAFDPNKDVTITVWQPFTPDERESGVFDSVVADFEKLHPNVDVKTVAGVNDEKIVAAVRGGNAPDVALSFSSDNTGAFCNSGAWIDLQPYIDRDKVDINEFPKAVQDYTEYQGTRCAMPLLADVYGLYYNKDMLAQAGITSPPKTYSELDADAKKLTQRSGDTINVAGFDPSIGFYENAAAHYAPPWDAQWFDGDKSALASDPAWASFLTWEKNLLDYYGYDNLQRFEAGAGDEFSASNAFENGKIAMIMDGEYRTAFIQDEHPELNYGTAPMPVPDGQESRYGAAYVTGSIMGIPKGSSNEATAWELIKYMTTNTDALVKLANGLANVPTTAAAASSPNLHLVPQFQPFLAMFKNPNTETNPPKASGAAYQELAEGFMQKWQAGQVSDLHSGLEGVASQIDAQEQNASGGQAP